MHASANIGPYFCFSYFPLNPNITKHTSFHWLENSFLLVAKLDQDFSDEDM